MNQPSASGEERESEETPAAKNPAEAAPAKNNEDAASENSNYTKYVVRPVRTLRRIWVGCVGFFDRHHGSITALSTVVIVVLTFNYWQTSLKQWEALKKANEISQTSLRVQQRAYVHVQKITVVPFKPKLGNVPQAIVEFKNTGATPAMNLYAAPASFLHRQQDGTESPPPPHIHEASLNCTPVGMFQILPPGVTRSVNTVSIHAPSGIKEPDAPPGILTQESLGQRYWVIDNRW